MLNSVIKQLRSALRHWRNPFLLLTGLAFFGIGLGVIVRLLNLQWPAKEVFDEVYFPVFAWKYLHRMDVFDVHPPLGKFLLIAGELVFGNTPLGWRIIPALFGIANIWLFWQLGKKWGKDNVAALILAALVALDCSLIVYSRTGLLDGIQFFFIFATFAFALSIKTERQIFWLATLLGLAVSIKWLAIAVIVPVAYILWRKKMLPVFILSLMWTFWLYIIIVYIGQVLIKVPNPWQGVEVWHQQAFNYHVNLKATHPWSSSWWSWPLMLRPVMFWYEGTAATGIRVITSIGNPLLWWSSTVAMLYALFRLGKEFWQSKKRSELLDHPLIPLLLGYLAFFLPWIPVNRVLFMYHYLPAYGFALPILGYFLVEEWQTRARGVLLFLFLALLVTLFFLPLVLGWPLSPESLAQHIWVKKWLY